MKITDLRALLVLIHILLRVVYYDLVCSLVITVVETQQLGLVVDFVSQVDSFQFKCVRKYTFIFVRVLV